MVKPDFWRATEVAFDASGDFYYAVETGGPVVYATEVEATSGRATGAARPLTAPGEASASPSAPVRP